MWRASQKPHFTALPSLLRGKGILFIYFCLNIHSSSIYHHFRWVLLVEKKKEPWDSHPPFAPGRLIHSTAVWPVFSHPFCPWRLFFPRLFYAKQSTPAPDVIPNSAPRSPLPLPEGLSSRQSGLVGRWPVTCSSLLPTGRWACIASRPQFPLEKWGVCPAQLGFHVGVGPAGSQSTALSANQTRSLTRGIVLGCYGRFAPKGTSLSLVPAVGISMIQTGWGLK